MLRLDSTLRKIEILLGGAVSSTQLTFVACWSDATAAAYTGGSSLGSTNNSTAVTVVGAPVSGTVRDVDYLSVINLDSATATVTLRYNDNGSLYNIVTIALPVGNHLIYTHAEGWRVVDAGGGTKTNLGGSAVITGGTIDNTAIGGTTPAAGSFTSLTDSGNLTFTGTGNRITGDFSNATLANRVAFKSSTTNGNTFPIAIPNGTATIAGFGFYNAVDPDNASVLSLSIQSTQAAISSDLTGSGTYLPLNLQTGGATQVRIPVTATTNRYITLAGSNGGNPTIGTSAGNLAISNQVLVVGSSLQNQFSINGSTTGNPCTLFAQGGDSNISLGISSKGTNSIYFATGVSLASQAQILDTAGATRYITLTGSNGGNPTISTSAGNLAIAVPLILSQTTLCQTSVALTNGAAAALGTLTNAPAAGNPTKWIPINDNGTTRYFPAW